MTLDYLLVLVVHQSLLVFRLRAGQQILPTVFRWLLIHWYFLVAAAIPNHVAEATGCFT